MADTIVFTTHPCMVCHKTSTLMLGKDAVDQWVAGTLIQYAFPNETPERREHIKTGTHPECWAAMFGDEDDDEEDWSDERDVTEDPKSRSDEHA